MKHNRIKKLILPISTVAIVLVAAVLLSSVAVFATGLTVEDCKHNQQVAHQMAECARELGYAEDHVVIQTASARWWEEQDLINMLNERDEEVVQIAAPEATQKADNSSGVYVTDDEYPVAAEIWNYCRNEMGLSEVCTAALLGNFACETGGCTLAIDPYIYTGGFYGIAMWALKYTDGKLTASSTLEEQLAYLSETLQKNMEYFGGSWDYFTSMSNPYNAAWYVTYYYERGGWSTKRGWCAMDAYNRYAVEGDG